jgi:hypothetical protein
VFQKARSTIHDFFNKSKISNVGKQQKIFLNNFKGKLIHARTMCRLGCKFTVSLTLSLFCFDL